MSYAMPLWISKDQKKSQFVEKLDTLVKLKGAKSRNRFIINLIESEVNKNISEINRELEFESITINKLKTNEDLELKIHEVRDEFEDLRGLENDIEFWKD